MTQEQCHALEANVIMRVREKEKIMKFSWVAGSGPVLKKKDRVMLSLAHASDLDHQSPTFFVSSSPR